MARPITGPSIDRAAAVLKALPHLKLNLKSGSAQHQTSRCSSYSYIVFGRPQVRISTWRPALRFFFSFFSPFTLCKQIQGCHLWIIHHCFLSHSKQLRKHDKVKVTKQTARYCHNEFRSGLALRTCRLMSALLSVSLTSRIK
jgi:hypothetical protein